MTKFYSITDPIKYEGPDSRNALAYRWYNPKQKVLGKSMVASALCGVLLAYAVLAGNRSVRRRNFQPPMAPYGGPHGSGGNESRCDV